MATTDTELHEPTFTRKGQHVVIHWPNGRTGQHDESDLLAITKDLGRLCNAFPGKQDWQETLATYKAALDFLQSEENPTCEDA